MRNLHFENDGFRCSYSRFFMKMTTLKQYFIGREDLEQKLAIIVKLTFIYLFNSSKRIRAGGYRQVQ